MTDAQAPRPDFSPSRPMRRRGVERYNILLDATERLLADSSDEDISLAQIADAAEVDHESVGMAAELGAGQGRPVDLRELGRARRVVHRHPFPPDAGAADGAGAVLDGAELQGVGPGTIQYGSPAHASDSGRRVVAHPPNQPLALVHGKLRRVVPTETLSR